MKRLVVTGASRGLGLEITRVLLESGYEVSAVARNSGELLRELQGRHPNALRFIPADLSNRQQLTEVCEALNAASTTPIWGLINNAALAHDGLLVTQSPEKISEVVEMNLLTPILLSRLLAKRMLIQGEGCIVFISSILAHRSGRGAATYAATKAALEGFTRALALELGPKGIRVNAVAPGYLQTQMSNALTANQVSRIERRSAAQRLAQVSEVANVVGMLVSPVSSAINGQVLAVDCGASIY